MMCYAVTQVTVISMGFPVGFLPMFTLGVDHPKYITWMTNPAVRSEGARYKINV